MGHVFCVIVATQLRETSLWSSAWAGRAGVCVDGVLPGACVPSTLCEAEFCEDPDEAGRDGAFFNPPKLAAFSPCGVLQAAEFRGERRLPKTLEIPLDFHRKI